MTLATAAPSIKKITPEVKATEPPSEHQNAGKHQHGRFRELMCDITQLYRIWLNYVCHVCFIFVTWLFHICDGTLLYVSRDAFIRDIHQYRRFRGLVRDMTQSYVTCLFHIRDMNHSYVTWTNTGALADMCDMTQSYVTFPFRGLTRDMTQQHDSFICDVTP